MARFSSRNTVASTTSAIVIGWKIGQSRRAPEEVAAVQTEQVEIEEGPTTSIELLFPGPDGRLHSEEREIPVQGDLVARIERTLKELIAGPQTEELFASLPPEFTVSWVHLNEAGVAYVDLDFAGDGPFPAWGSGHEMLAVFSVVNSLFANLPEIDSVVLLRDGQQQPTFAGHLDTSHPLRANALLVADR